MIRKYLLINRDEFVAIIKFIVSVVDATSLEKNQKMITKRDHIDIFSETCDWPQYQSHLLIIILRLFNNHYSSAPVASHKVQSNPRFQTELFPSKLQTLKAAFPKRDNI